MLMSALRLLFFVSRQSLNGWTEGNGAPLLCSERPKTDGQCRMPWKSSGPLAR